jgi:hypothetical protein
VESVHRLEEDEFFDLQGRATPSAVFFVSCLRMARRYLSTPTVFLRAATQGIRHTNSCVG